MFIKIVMRRIIVYFETSFQQSDSSRPHRENVKRHVCFIASFTTVYSRRRLYPDEETDC